MKRTVTFQQEHFEKLRAHLLPGDGKEHVAFLLFGLAKIENDPWTKEPEVRLLCREIDIVSDKDLIENHNYQITWNNNRFIPLLKKAEQKSFSVGIIHSHPGGYNSFSDVDDENEKNLAQLVFNRNGPSVTLASFIMTPPGDLIGRFWESDSQSHKVPFIRVLGDRFKFFYQHKKEFVPPEYLNRQKLAFGNALIEELAQIRIGIIGCGATGSAASTLLARLGIGHLLIIDKDVIEVTNLNRLHGATIEDIGQPKVSVLKKTIEKIGLGTKIEIIDDWVSSQKAKNALKSCDLIFGCSDDNAGRILLNRFAYFYLIPLIDMGLTIHLSSEAIPHIQTLIGRVTVVFPGNRCLNSYGIINSEIAYSENLRRNEPEQFKKLKEEAYVIGEGNPNPAVGTFTTETATIAVNEFLHRFQGYRNTGSVNNRLRFFHMDEDIRVNSEPEKECRICGSQNYWGRGDMDPFLDMV